MEHKPNEQYTELTTIGKAFIKEVCSKENKLSGHYTWDMKDGGIVAFQIVTGNVKYNDKPITNMDQYGDAIIEWYNYYGDKYNINPNVIAAQGFLESSYRTYAFPDTSTAMGISQFIVPTLYDYIIENKFGYFTQEEIDKITNGIVAIDGQDIDYFKNYFVLKYDKDNLTASSNDEANIATSNKLTLYQNVIDNTEIMIKSQAVYMANIAQFHKNVAASTLALYMAGPEVGWSTKRGGVYTSFNNYSGSTNFGTVIDVLANRKDDLLVRSLDYAKFVFRTLVNNFGFELSLKEIDGNDLKDTSLSHVLRLPHA